MWHLDLKVGMLCALALFTVDTPRGHVHIECFFAMALNYDSIECVRLVRVILYSTELECIL